MEHSQTAALQAKPRFLVLQPPMGPRSRRANRRLCSEAGEEASFICLGLPVRNSAVRNSALSGPARRLLFQELQLAPQVQGAHRCACMVASRQPAPLQISSTRRGLSRHKHLLVTSSSPSPCPHETFKGRRCAASCRNSKSLAAASTCRHCRVIVVTLERRAAQNPKP